MGVTAKYVHFNGEGKPLESGHMHLPLYLDWMPIAAKSFWFLERGLGHPDATHTLFECQDEQWLLGVTGRLNQIDVKTLKENTHDLEERIEQYCRENRISRTPRNQ